MPMPRHLPAASSSGENDSGSCRRRIWAADNIGPKAQTGQRSQRRDASAGGEKRPNDAGILLPLLIGLLFVIGILAGVRALSNSRRAATMPAAAQGAIVTSPIDGMRQLYVPAGPFKMGSNKEADERPVHNVTLDAFWIDQTEVTNAMFRRFVEATGYQTDAEKIGSGYAWTGSGWNEIKGADWQHPRGPDSNIAGREDHPVVQVSWSDAAAYCEWAGRRLPTEAEWEKAARGTDGRVYPWGNSNPDCTKANYSGCAGDTSRVGSYLAGISPYGALDMAGNVWEWVADWYDSGYYRISPTKNPTGPATGDARVQRGGAWDFSHTVIYAASRSWGFSGVRHLSSGFRCARSADSE